MTKAAAVLCALIVSSASAHGQSLKRQVPDRNERSAQEVSPDAAGGPLMLIYRVTGLRDNAQASATRSVSLFSCTNFSITAERIRFLVYNYNTALAEDYTLAMNARTTYTVATGDASAFTEDAYLTTGNLAQGMAIIQSTSRNVQCTSMVLDASSPVPSGIDLHMVRFNAQTGSME